MLHYNQTEIKSSTEPVKGEFVDLEGRRYYKISNYDRMRPFLMTITSSSNHWMFLSSKGGLTCGRRNSAHALFPYYSDDKIHESHYTTGPKTFVKVRNSKKEYFWEPFNLESPAVYAVKRNIYKSISGNSVVFEEINYDLKLSFRYQWANSNRFGFIRKVELRNLSADDNCQLDIVDGLMNILPPDINPDMQANMSTLLDAYKVSRFDRESSMGMYLLSSAISDRAEALESLKANIVYQLGLNASQYFLSDQQIYQIKNNLETTEEEEINGQRGNYFVKSSFPLHAETNKRWSLVADVDLSHAEIINFREGLKDKEELSRQILSDIQRGDEQLLSYVAKADGIQFTNDEHDTARHFSNVMFNIMRGGFFPENYLVYRDDFLAFINTWNKKTHKKYQLKIRKLSEKINVYELIENIKRIDDADLTRLVYEYLPLTFSRRHGDPSRPWNKFDINIGDPEKRLNIGYQGNWRDIFQNWEALLFSYPEFIEQVVIKFLNASTIDGYNPYRITSEGIDWELFDPEDPWSNIGYWGDHQIIYLLRLLELLRDHKPEGLHKLLFVQQFVYANVPYRIKELKLIFEDPNDTIEYDSEMEKIIGERVRDFGSDGKLVFEDAKKILHASMFEKLLLPFLTKLSNFVPGAGIWMNAQRPEWNDANNALVGNGTSMVTLYYMRRYLTFLTALLNEVSEEETDMSQYVEQFYAAQMEVFVKYRKSINNGFNDELRFAFTKEIGKTGEAYRKSVYNQYVKSSLRKVSLANINVFLSITADYIDYTIEKNRRYDGLYHSYNLIDIEEDKISVSYLREMLEGQVAVISSGYLDMEETAALVKNIRNSDLYRPDQNSYMLYPNELPGVFLDKNTIDNDTLVGIPLLKKLVSEKCYNIIERDVNGGYHFTADIRNKNDLMRILDHLQESKDYKELVAENQKEILHLFEKIFDHRSFTGRSGRFFKYEGLGSIYWHMVSKYALSVIEKVVDVESEDAENELVEFYKDIKRGIGAHKSPGNYGAFPSDPYSHTPIFSGVQQPGMTGQVKEDIISRWNELGVRVIKGKITFRQTPFVENSYLKKNQNYEWIDVKGEKQNHKVKESSLFFTWCQVPVIYKQKAEKEIKITYENGSDMYAQGHVLPSALSNEIFRRTGRIRMIEVGF